MNKPNDAEWFAAISRVTERLELAEIRHRMVMDELKQEIEMLRKRPSASTEGNEVALTEALPVTSLPVFEPEEPLAPPLLPVRFSEDVSEEMELPAAEEESFEQKLGQVWLVRIGILLVLTSLVLGVNWAYKNWIYDLAAGARLTGLYLCAALMGGCGI